MRIAEALERFRFGDQATVPFDQLGPIDLLTEYPVINDPALKKPMLYYCSGADWIIVAGTVGKPYKKALAAINSTNKELRFCRVQIEKFEEKYFNPPQVAVLAERAIRIPLVNLFRYYAMWKFVALHSDKQHITLVKVQNDFSLIITSAVERYQELVDIVAKAMASASKSEDSGEMFENLRWLQKVVDVPSTVLDKEHCNTILGTLLLCAQIEADVENRIATELPAHIELLKKDILDFPRELIPNIQLTPFNRSYFYEIDTTHAEIVNEYARVESIHESLYALKSSASDSTWEVSTNSAFNAAFNSVSLRDVHGHLAGALSLTPDQEIYELLFLFNLAFGDAPDVLSDLRQLLATEPFNRNPVNQLMLVHLFFPFYVAGLQFERIGTTRVKFMDAATELRSCLLSLPKHDLDDLLSIAVRSEMAWTNWSVPVGFVYHLLVKLGKELLRGTSKDATMLLVENCGSGREHMFDYLSSSKIDKLFLDSARFIENETRIKFAYKHYEEYGFIVSKRTVMPLAIEVVDIPDLIDAADPVPTKTVDISILLTREGYPLETANKYVGKEHNYFADHEEFTDKWKAKWPEIIENCHARATDLIKRLCVPDEPTTADFLACLKEIVESKTLTSKIPEGPLVIDGKDKNAHERYMIGRLVVLGLSLEVRDLDSVAWLCGFRSKDKIRYTGVLPSPPNRSRLERYLNTLGLRLGDVGAPLDSKRINLREQAFLQDSPWRK